MRRQADLIGSLPHHITCATMSMMASRRLPLISPMRRTKGVRE